MVDDHLMLIGGEWVTSESGMDRLTELKTIVVRVD
jgi:hypothetical protein